MVVMLLNAKQIKSFKRKKDISSQNSKNKIYSDCENIFKNEKKKKNQGSFRWTKAKGIHCISTLKEILQEILQIEEKWNEWKLKAAGRK